MRYVWRVLILLAIVLLLAGLGIWRYPANLAAKQLGLQQQPLNYQTASGTIWHGKLQQLNWHDIKLDLQWTTTAIHQLIPFSASWDIAGRGEQFNGDLALRFSKPDRYAINDLHISLPGEWIDFSGLMPLVAVRGQFQLDFPSAQFTTQTVDYLDGMIQWRDASLSGLVQADLGHIEARAIPVVNGTQIQIRSLQAAPVEVSADGVLTASKFQMELWMTFENPDNSLYTMLANVGEVMPDGRLRLQFYAEMSAP